MEPYLAQIVMFGGNFAPRGWAFCNGQLLAINDYSALFSLLGTTFGGDGRTTFGLPELRGRLPIQPGNGPGLTPRTWGQKLGTETNSLTQANMAAGFPNITVHNGTANQTSPVNHQLAEPIDGGGGALAGYSDAAAGGSLGGVPKGSGQAVNNLAPFVCVNFIIALQGIYPSRS